MGGGILCCKRKIGQEPEIVKHEQTQGKDTSSILRGINNSYIFQQESPILDEKTYFLNKINKIGNKLSPKEFNEIIPENIKKYIKDQTFENNFLQKKKEENLSNCATEIDNINFNVPVQLKSNNIIYIGEWTKEGVINGKGKMFRPDTNTYIEGEWGNGNLKYGRIINDEGVYIGSIDDNQFHGQGKFSDYKGNIYEGYWSHGQKHGQGIMKYSDGCVYSGIFENNQMHGQGEFTWNNKNYFKGEFVNGIFCGRGIFKADNGNIYNGDFEKGYFHGSGIFFWNSFDEYYKGEYSMNQKDGKGLYKFRNGDIYMGQWFNGKPNGKGTFETKNKIYTGVWKDGQFNELLDIVSKYQSGEISENIELNFSTLKEDIDISKLEHLNTKMMFEIN